MKVLIKILASVFAVFVMVVVFGLIVVIGGFFVSLLWNATMVSQGLTAISIWDGTLLYLLARLLFGNAASTTVTNKILTKTKSRSVI